MPVLLLTVAGAIVSLGFALFQIDTQRNSDAELRARLQQIQNTQQVQEAQQRRQLQDLQQLHRAAPPPAASRPLSGTAQPAGTVRRSVPAASSAPASLSRPRPSAVAVQRLSLPPSFTGKRPDPPANYVVPPRPAGIASHPARVASRRPVSAGPKTSGGPRPPTLTAKKTVPFPAVRATVAAPTPPRPTRPPRLPVPGSSPASTQEPVYGDLQADDAAPQTP